MILEELRCLSDREIDAAIAEWLGLPVVWRTLAPYFRPGEPIPEGRHPYLKGIVAGCEYDWAEVCHYTRDLRHLYTIETEIARQCLQRQYIASLMLSVGQFEFPSVSRELFGLVHTTARQRCEAVLIMKRTPLPAKALVAKHG